MSPIQPVRSVTPQSVYTPARRDGWVRVPQPLWASATYAANNSAGEALAGSGSQPSRYCRTTCHSRASNVSSPGVIEGEPCLVALAQFGRVRDASELYRGRLAELQGRGTCSAVMGRRRPLAQQGAECGSPSEQGAVARLHQIARRLGLGDPRQPGVKKPPHGRFPAPSVVYRNRSPRVPEGMSRQSSLPRPPRPA